MKQKKRQYRLSLCEKDVFILELFLQHSIDAIYGDTRHDHGLAMMKKFTKNQILIVGAIRNKLSRWRLNYNKQCR